MELSVADIGNVYVVAGRVSTRALVIYLGKHGSFGEAFGLLGPANTVEELRSTSDPVVSSVFPLFVDPAAVLEGRWPLFCVALDLVSLFREPALYHHPSFDPEDPGLRPFGLAEYTDGREVSLSEEDAAEVFGGRPTEYRQVYQPEDLEELVDQNSADLSDKALDL